MTITGNLHVDGEITCTGKLTAATATIGGIDFGTHTPPRRQQRDNRRATVMRVSGLDKNLDWRFGKGRAVYKRNADAIAQNILTRLRSFLGDWYLDTEIGIDWLKLLGNLGTEKRILRAVESTVMQTEGVLSIQELKIIGRDSSRGVTIRIRYTDVFGTSKPQTLEFTA